MKTFTAFIIFYLCSICSGIAQNPEPGENQIYRRIAERDYENVFSVEITHPNGKKDVSNVGALIETKVIDDFGPEQERSLIRTFYLIDDRSGQSLARFTRVRVTQEGTNYRIRGSSDSAIGASYLDLLWNPHANELSGKLKVLSQKGVSLVKGSRRYCPTLLRDFFPDLSPNPTPLSFAELMGTYTSVINSGPSYQPPFKRNAPVHLEGFSSSDFMGAWGKEGGPNMIFSLADFDADTGMLSLISGRRFEGLVKWVLRCIRPQDNGVHCRGYGFSSINGVAYEVDLKKQSDSGFQSF